MNILAIKATIFLFVGFLNFFLSLLAWFKGKTKATFHLGLLAFFSSVYVGSFGLSYVFVSYTDLRLFFSRLTWIGVIALSSAITFVYYFTEKVNYVRFKSIFLYFIGAAITFLAVTTPLFISKTYLKDSLISIGKTGPLDFLGRIFIIVGVILILEELIRYYFAITGLKKVQTAYLIWGTGVYAFMSIIGAGLAPLIFKSWGADLPVEISSLFSFFWVSLTAYAIIRRELFGIKVILTDLLVGIMGIILLVLIFLMPTIALKVLIASVFILFCFFGYYLIKAVHEEEKRRQGAERLVQKEAKMREESERIAHEETKRREEAERFKNISLKLKERISHVLDLEEVIPHITNTLTETFKIEKISFALKQPTSEFYQFHKTIGFPEKELAAVIRDTALCTYLERARKPLIKEDLKDIQGALERNKIGLLLPLFQKQMLIGIIFLGEKSAAAHYFKEDIDLLEALSYQISISLNNALLYEEIKKDKEALEKFYSLTVGREVRMAELKKKIKELEGKLKGKEDPL